MASTETTTTETKAEAEKPVSTEVRKAPLIDHKTAYVELPGLNQKKLVCFAPDGLEFTDLNAHPQIWKKIQGDRNLSLNEWDEIEIRGENVMYTGRVSHADAEKCVLFAIERKSKPVRDVGGWSDANFEIKWIGGGFTYFRKRDGVRMHLGTWPTIDSCRHELMRREYPVTIG